MSAGVVKSARRSSRKSTELTGRLPVIYDGTVTDARALLIEQRANLNLADIDGYAALHALVGMDDAVLLRQAIALVADIEHPDKTGATPFLFAATYARANCMQVLVDAGATITARDSEGLGAVDLLAKWSTLMSSATAIGATAKVLKWAQVDTDGQSNRPPQSGRQAPCGGPQPPP